MSHRASRVWPCVRILAEAFAPGLPRRDLLVSPDHALFVDGKLIAARMLVNGMTIRQDTDCRSVTYYHVELDAHDVLLAEGLPEESYLDTGNRGMFENAVVPITLKPDFADADESTRRAAGSCAPFAVDEALVRPVWQRLADRVAPLGWDAPATAANTDDPGICVMAAGSRIRPVSAADHRYAFMLHNRPNCSGRTCIPRAVPAWLGDG